jgi:acyl-CoA hydrolase
VTEHGVADLRGVDDPERARRIAAVAAPEHRAWLQAEAKEAG